MIKCILIDDELPALRYLQTLCMQIEDIEIVKAYNRTDKFLNEHHKLDYNTCILDIHMPEMSGLELATELEHKAIIFSTAHKEFAADAFDLNAVDYMRKPYHFDRLQSALQKARNYLLQQQYAKVEGIEFNTALGKAMLVPNEILYIQVSQQDRRDKDIILQNGSSILVKNITLDTLVELLPTGQFCRINKRTIVSLSKVEAYSSQTVNVRYSGAEIITLSLSVSFKQDFSYNIQRFFSL